MRAASRREGALGRPPTRWEQLAYRVVRAAVVGFSRAFWALTVSGREHVPAAGPFVLAPVHRSYVDTMVVAAVTRRRLRYMGKEELWKYPWSAAFFTTLGGFPVHRGTADRDALRRCAAVVAGGEPLVMFPEGTRRSGPVVEALFDGPAFVAARTGVPILPVGIGGSEPAMPRGARWVRPVHIHLEVGPPIHPAPVEDGARVPRRAVRELSERLRADLQRLYDSAQARAGTPNP